MEERRTVLTNRMFPLMLLDNAPISSIPVEIMALVFNKLSHNNLHIVNLVSKNWLQVASKQHYDMQCQEQLLRLENSELWQYLPTILNDGNILPFLQRQNLLPEEIECTELNLSQFFSMITKVFPCSSHAYLENLTEVYIKKQTKLILNKRTKHGLPTPKTLEHFFKFPFALAKEQKKVSRAYQNIEESFATLRLLIQIWKKEQSSPPLTQEDLIELVCDSKMTQHLTGSGLLLINDVYPFRNNSIFYTTCLIQELIKLSIVAYQKDDGLTVSPSFIDAVLSKMTHLDWENFLSLDSPDDFTQSRVANIIQALQCNHQIILRKLNETVLMKIIKNSHGMKPHRFIVQSSIALNHLSDLHLIELAASFSSDNFQKILETSPLFVQRINFELIVEILKKNNTLAKFFLMNSHVLNNLKDKGNQIPAIAKFLSLDHVIEIVQSPAFLSVLNKMALLENGRQIRSHFLVKLAAANNRFIPYVIAENNNILAMLEQEDVQTIAQLNSTAKEIIKDKYPHFFKRVILTPSKSYAKNRAPTLSSSAKIYSKLYGNRTINHERSSITPALNSIETTNNAPPQAAQQTIENTIVINPRSSTRCTI